MSCSRRVNRKHSLSTYCVPGSLLSTLKLLPYLAQLVTGKLISRQFTDPYYKRRRSDCSCLHFTEEDVRPREGESSSQQDWGSKAGPVSASSHRRSCVHADRLAVGSGSNFGQWGHSPPRGRFFLVGVVETLKGQERGN